MFEWDEDKRRTNLAKHGVDFADLDDMDWGTADTRPDARTAYGEARFLTMGRIGARLHVLIWTPRNGRMRVISLRKANPREEKAYAAGPTQLH